jgi:hypothetical protein
MPQLRDYIPIAEEFEENHQWDKVRVITLDSVMTKDVQL